jgi:hypothetical protein
VGSSKHIFIDVKEKTDQNHNATVGRVSILIKSQRVISYMIGEI